jgi:hypothetical protein
VIVAFGEFDPGFENKQVLIAYADNGQPLTGVTRPRERLYLSHCLQRSRDGRAEFRQPSRWLYALPPELVAPSDAHV